MRALLLLPLLSGLLSGVTLVGCVDDIDEPWMLDHDRIIAVRASTPRILSGETATLDALLGKKGAPPEEAIPPLAQVISPESLAGALAGGPAGWTVTAPDEATLAAARTELGLAADAPVPLTIGVAFPTTYFPNATQTDPFAALKTVYLGERAENPALTNIVIGEADGNAITEFVIPAAEDTYVSIDADVNEAGDDVNWLTSCGTMHDYDLARGYLSVEEEDPLEGQFVVVLRQRSGGVAWKIWSIAADGPPPPATK